MSWGALYLYASSIRSEWGSERQLLNRIESEFLSFMGETHSISFLTELSVWLGHSWELQTTSFKWMFRDFQQKIWNHPIETIIYKWMFQVLVWYVLVLAACFGLCASLLASNMLGRWSVDGIFTMRRVPREHQAISVPWFWGRKTLTISQLGLVVSIECFLRQSWRGTVWVWPLCRLVFRSSDFSYRFESSFSLTFVGRCRNGHRQSR